MSFIDRLCEMITSPRALTAEEKAAAMVSFEDTVAVVFAGWGESSAVAARAVYARGPAELFDGSCANSTEHAALVHAIAGHALDYDDVHLVSVTHPSVVLVPALMAFADVCPSLSDRVIDAYAVGLGVNIALGEALGFRHYDLGWHATSTIGPVAGAAALSYLLGFDAITARNALSLASAQSGGFQANFGTQAKHVQAGQAAAAAVRAALLAQAGVTGSPDIFGGNGFLALFGGVKPKEALDEIVIEPDTLSISRKLFPCCYLTHRMIAAALDVRGLLGDDLPHDACVKVDVPYGGMRPLRVSVPQTGAQAKFCAAYCVATALKQGKVGLSDFEDGAVHRPDIQKIMSQVVIKEDPLVGDMPTGIDHGVVRLRVERAGKSLAEADIRYYPASPKAPTQHQAFEAKISECLALWQRETGHSLTPDAFRNNLRRRLGVRSSCDTLIGTM